MAPPACVERAVAALVLRERNASDSANTDQTGSLVAPDRAQHLATRCGYGLLQPSSQRNAGRRESARRCLPSRAATRYAFAASGARKHRAKYRRDKLPRERRALRSASMAAASPTSRPSSQPQDPAKKTSSRRIIPRPRMRVVHSTSTTQLASLQRHKGSAASFACRSGCRRVGLSFAVSECRSVCRCVGRPSMSRAIL